MIDLNGGVFANGTDTTAAKVSVVSRNNNPYVVEFEGGEPEVIKTGYSLIENAPWITATGEAISADTVYEDAVFYANWRQNNYTVTYNSNKPGVSSNEVSGSTADSHHIYDNDGESLTTNGYTLKGWTFKGWNTNADGTGAKFDGTAGNYIDAEHVKNLTTEDAKVLELFAQWDANTYHVAYNSNKPSNASSTVSGSMADSIMTYDTTSKLSPFAYSLPGYTWTGWNDASDGNGTAYADEADVINLSDTQDATVTMYAQWDPNEYIVTFDNTIGTITGDASKTVTFDAEYGTLPTLNEKTGYTAQGWYTAATDGTKVDENTQVTIPNDHTLYARWTPNVYNINFDTNMESQPDKVSSNASVTPVSQPITYDAEYGTLPTPTWPGWTFEGWYLTADGTTERTSTDIVQVTSDETVYAQWTDETAPTFTVNATTGGVGTNGTISFANVVEEGSGIEGYYIGQTNPANSAVTFGTTTSVTVNNSGTWYLAIKDKAGNISQIESVEYYSLALNNNNATNYTSNSAYVKANSTITLPTGLTKTGYTSNGWSTTAGATSGSTTWTATSNTTLYPVWKANQYTVTFNANGGSCGTSSKTVTYAGTYGTLPTPTRTGYSFNGWFTSASGGSQIVSQTTVYSTNNHTLYAHWTVNNYTLIFNANGGYVGESSRSIAYGSAYGTLPTPSLSGYMFMGWYTAPSGGSQVSAATTMGAGNVTVYAQWAQLRTESFEMNYEAVDGGYIGEYFTPPGFSYIDSYTVTSKYNTASLSATKTSANTIRIGGVNYSASAGREHVTITITGY